MCFGPTPAQNLGKGETGVAFELLHRQKLRFGGDVIDVQVKLDYDTQLRLMISILAALAEGPDVLRETSAENIMHLLQGLLSQPRFKTSSEASSKSTFKLLVLNMFRLSAVSKQAHNSVVKLASTAFESRPYTFMIALTDALEDENHPALKGAVSFANDAFLADLRESGLFLVRACLHVVLPKLLLLTLLQTNSMGIECRES